MVLYWGSFKPRSIISYLSMCWRRAERSQVKSLDVNGPSVWSLRHDIFLTCSWTKALPGHRASWLSLSSSTCLQLIFLISCSSVSCFSSDQSRLRRPFIHRSMFVCAVWTREIRQRGARDGQITLILMWEHIKGSCTNRSTQTENRLMKSIWHLPVTWLIEGFYTESKVLLLVLMQHQNHIWVNLDFFHLYCPVIGANMVVV